MKGEKTFFAETFSLPGWGPISVDKPYWWPVKWSLNGLYLATSNKKSSVHFSPIVTSPRYSRCLRHDDFLSSFSADVSNLSLWWSSWWSWSSPLSPLSSSSLKLRRLLMRSGSGWIIFLPRRGESVCQSPRRHRLLSIWTLVSTETQLRCERLPWVHIEKGYVNFYRGILRTTVGWHIPIDLSNFFLWFHSHRIFRNIFLHGDAAKIWVVNTNNLCLRLWRDDPTVTAKNETETIFINWREIFISDGRWDARVWCVMWWHSLNSSPQGISWNPSPHLGDLLDDEEDAYPVVLAAVRMFSSRNFSTLDFGLTPSEALQAWIASA